MLFLECVGCAALFDSLADAHAHAEDFHYECERGNSHTVMFAVVEGN